MSILKVLLLGPPAVYYDDMPLTIQRRTLRVVLYYLAQQENMIDRAQLILALWPEENESTGRRRLRELLSKLRAELPDASLLITEQDQIGLDRSRLYVDSLRFDEIFKECSPIVNTIPRHTPLPERTHQQIRTATDLWRTPYFMAGVQMPESETLDRWVSETGRMLERRRILLIDRQSDHYAALGDIESALSWLGRIIDDDPDNEDWQVRYLTWLNQLNRRSEATAYNDFLFHHYKDRDEPLPDRIKTAFFVTDHHPAAAELEKNPLWPPPTQLQTPFVGRAQEIQQLTTAYQRGGVIILWGEPGSGKTRLIYEFSKRVVSRTRLLMAGGFSSTHDLPYQPILEMLRQSVSDKEWRAMLPAWLTPLTSLIPELGRYVPQASRIADTHLGDVQGMIFESLHQVFKSLARQSRLLVFLDDAHHSDRSSLDVLEYLFSRGFFEHHGLLVVSARPEEKNPSLEKFIDQVRNPSYRFEEIHIPDFTLEDASALMALMLGRSYSAHTVQQVLELSDGKPLFLVEMLRSVLEYSAWVDLEEIIDHLPLPRSILDLVQRRIGMLSVNARRVLQIASVTNGNFRPAMLELALDLKPEEVVDALEELERYRLVQSGETSPTGANYRFLYSHILNIVLADISEARKRLLHLSIAKAMKSLPLESSNPSQIASHFELGGELVEAFDYWILAGNRARELFSRTDAEYAFSRAASLIQYLGNFVTEEEIYKLYTDWGDLLDEFDDYKSGLDLFYNLQALGNQRQSHILMGTAFNGLSRIFRNIGEYDRSLQYNLQAEEHLKISGLMPEYFTVFTRRAITYIYLEDFEKSDLAIKKAIELASQTQSWRIQIGLSSTFVQMADISSYKGRLHKTLEICDLGLRSIESTFNNPDIEMIRLKMAQVHCMFGYPKKAYMLANQVLKLATEWNHNRLIGFAKQARAQAAMEMGWMGECLDDLEDTLEIATQYNFKDLAPKTYSQLGDFYRVLGELHLAERAYVTGLESTARPYFRLDNQIRQGYILTQLNKIKEGKDIIDKALQEAETGGFRLIQTTAHSFLASGFLKSGDTRPAEEAIDAYNDTAQEVNVPRWNMLSQLFSVFLKYKKGDQVDENELEPVISFAREGGDIWLEIEASCLMLEIQRRRGIDENGASQRMMELQNYLLERARREGICVMISNLFDNLCHP
ncbi:MAG: AAA family ATPase [Chloroflexi bacterium]|nr:AAA family ATPase [Chloroflexota bacterium]